MNLKIKIYKKASRKLFSSLIKALVMLTFARPSNALIPFVYEPNVEVLTKTSLNIGRTAIQLLELGQNKQAVQLAKLAIKIKENDSRLWSILAEAQQRNGLLQEAIASIRKAKQLNPYKADLWFAEASLELAQKKPNNAITLLNHGLTIDPRNAGAYFQLGNARIMQNKLILAIKSFRKASKINPNFWEALNNEAIVLFEIGQPKEAIKIWRKVLILERNPEPMLALAAALHQINPKSPEAIDLTNQALAKNPNYVSALHQEEQLWGKNLIEATNQLLQRSELSSVVERAQANSDANDAR